MLPSCDASNKIMDTAQSSVHSKTENNFVFKSSLLPTTTTAASQKSKLLLGNEKFNKIKNEYHQFASNATSSIMDFENTIKQDNSDMDNTFKYLTPDTNKKIINTIKSNNKEMKELIKDKITDSLKTLKKSINNAKSPDGIGNPRLDSLEKTAEAFAIRMQKRLEELS
ncbi:hypothetical protein EB241_04315 [Erwinia psidii]|uniref:Uncharacterized protein n=2 Tax=Erwinia psidii TaxID=69224 RepID=A0A3N6S442_9GAMM|nr:hypothetical protein EB241_04315 [Erwinia psidii]